MSLVGSVVLAHPDFSRHFILATDASLGGIGAVLSQVQEGETRARPVAFASKSLSRSQRNYPAHRLEFLALKWSICEKFGHWLKGHNFTVLTDNNPLAHILTKPKLDCCEQRWVAKLASFNFDIKYVPGPQNVIADSLSRVPFVKSGVTQRLLRVPYDTMMTDMKGMSTNSVQDAFRCSCGKNQEESVIQQQQQLCTVNNDFGNDVLTVASLDVSAVLASHLEWKLGADTRAMAVVDHLPQMVPTGQDTLPAFSVEDLREKQMNDRVLSRVMSYVESCRRPTRRERAGESAAVLRYLKHWEKLIVRNGVLYRVSHNQSSRTKYFQYIVPDSLVDVILRSVHDDSGHQGQFRSVSLAKQRFFWLNMEHRVRDYVRHCQRCIISKCPDPSSRAPLENIKSTRPLELVCIDFWSAEDVKNKSIDVLVVTDHFTRLAQAFVCRDQSAKQVARVLWDRYFCIYGLPEHIHSDQGASFESRLIGELLRVSGVEKSHTTPYHPMGNGSVERFNRTLGNMIRALSPDIKRDWPRRLQTLTFLYNCTTHESTGYAPFYLMFGRVPRLPVDILFRSVLNDQNLISYDKYVDTLVKDLREAMVIAQKHATKEQKRHAALYNRRVKGFSIDVGDQVLLANKAERGKRKTADRWESTVYTVVDHKPQTHTYRIRNPVTGQEKVVHRNLLLLVDFLPVPEQISVDCPVSLVSDPHSNMPSSSSSQKECSAVLSEPSPQLKDDDITSEAVALTSHLDDDTDRTLSWVTHLPDESPESTSSVVSGDVIVNPTPQAAPATSFGTISVMSDEVAVDECCSDSGSIESANTVTSARAHSQSSGVTLTNFTPVDGSSTRQIRSRFGHVIKPVDRLIQTMSGQAVIQDAKRNVEAVCKSMFRALVN
uniref:Gypsy retrotransposon integrase-like protein 1 n=1 Tax=Cyprinus carpio TaxID=7962 RepID=A0A8C1XJY0_CYPCA